MNTKDLKISPRAQQIALQNQIDVSKLTPTGPDGRIIERDVLRALTEKTEMPIDIAEENKSIEQAEIEEMKEEIAAEKLTEEAVTEEIAIEEISEEKAEGLEIHAEIAVEEKTAIVTAPMIAVTADEIKREDPKEEKNKEKTFTYSTEAYRHTDVIIPRTEQVPEREVFTISMSFDATALLRLRQTVKENAELMGLQNITLNDMILFATAKLLKKNKICNAHFLGDKIRYFDGVHLGFVVDTGHGMETPTVFDAERLSLSSLSKITGALIRGARAGNVSPEKNKLCASFMVTNLGMLGVESFSPVLTAPQTSALGVCALQKRIKTVDGKDVSYPCIPLSLTFDTRALDTASAAKFLRELCASLERFELLLIK